MGEYQKFLKELTSFLFVEKKLASEETADIIFIPGNGYPQMSICAANLWKEGKAPRILPSGKYSISVGQFTGPWELQERYGGDFETEGAFMKHILVSEGVAEEAIWVENEATYTYENAMFSKRMTEGKGYVIKKAILCCRNIHARRCLMYYQLLYPETEFFVYPCAIGNITQENWNQSQAGVQAVFGEAERITTQFSVWMKEKTPAD